MNHKRPRPGTRNHLGFIPLAFVMFGAWAPGPVAAVDLTLRWNAPTNYTDGTPAPPPAVIRYTLEESHTGAPPSAADVAAGVTVRTVTNLAAGPLYEFRVRGVDTNGAPGVWSAVLPWYSQTQLAPSPAPGEYYSEIEVALYSTPTGTINFTTDGTEPGGFSEIYTGPISISTDTVLKAVAYSEGSAPSMVFTGVYSFAQAPPVPATPAFWWRETDPGPGPVAFNGVDEVETHPIPINGETQLTVVVRMAPVDVDPGPHGVFFAPVFWDETGSWGTCHLTPTPAGVQFRFGTGQNGNLPVYIGDLSGVDNYAITKNGPEETLYINGAPVATFTGKQNAVANCQDVLNLGRGYQGTFVACELFDVLVYRRALTPGEHMQLSGYLDGRWPSTAEPPVLEAPEMIRIILQSSIDLKHWEDWKYIVLPAEGPRSFFG